MSTTEAERMLGAIGAMLNLMLLQEPSEDGRPLRYNPVDYAILREIERHDGCNGSELARRFNAARTTIQSALDRLERMGLIEKRQASAQAKVRSLHLTDQGRLIRQRIHAHDLANMEALLAPLDAAERDYILPRLEKIAAALTAGAG